MNSLIIFGAKYLLFVSFAVALFYFLKQARQRQKEMIFFAFILLPVSYILAKIIGHFFFDPRPFTAGNFAPLIPHAPDNGFPSDHTLLAAAIAVLIFQFNKKMGWLLFGFAILVGLARVAAGIHHFTDITGSIIIVLAVYFLQVYFFQRSRRMNK